MLPKFIPPPPLPGGLEDNERFCVTINNELGRKRLREVVVFDVVVAEMDDDDDDNNDDVTGQYSSKAEGAKIADCKVPFLLMMDFLLPTLGFCSCTCRRFGCKEFIADIGITDRERMAVSERRDRCTKAKREKRAYLGLISVHIVDTL